MKWQISSPLNRNQISLIDEWYSNTTPTIQAEFDAQLLYLANVPRQEWKHPDAKHLKGGDGIYEIRFKADRVQQRPLGFFGPGQNQFTIVFFATEKGDNFVPKDALKRAIKKMNAVINREYELKSYDEFDPIQDC